MSVKTRDELIAEITSSFGENLCDSNLAILENVRDTIQDATDYTKQRFEELDSTWRKKYSESFTAPTQTIAPEITAEPIDQRANNIRYADLYS